MCAWFEFSFGSWFIDPTPIAQLVSRTLFDRATSEPACSFIRLYWHQISFLLLLYGQRIDTHLTHHCRHRERFTARSGRFYVVYYPTLLCRRHSMWTSEMSLSTCGRWATDSRLRLLKGATGHWASVFISFGQPMKLHVQFASTKQEESLTLGLFELVWTKQSAHLEPNMTVR